jgi:hypothetical protein
MSINNIKEKSIHSDETGKTIIHCAAVLFVMTVAMFNNI